MKKKPQKKRKKRLVSAPNPAMAGNSIGKPSTR
jgi:hypothetical protein